MNLLHYLRIYSAGPALFSLGMKIAAEARLFRISIAVIARARRPLKRPLIFQAPAFGKRLPRTAASGATVASPGSRNGTCGGDARTRSARSQ